MAMKKVVTAWFDLAGDGSSTTASIDLASAGVSFTAGLANGTPFEIGKYINREVSSKFDPTVAPSSVFAVFTDNTNPPYSVVSNSLSGTVLTVGISPALPSDSAVRICAELLYA